MELQNVREIIRMRGATRLPGTAASSRGIINLRGEIVPLVDLREKLGLAAVDYGHATRIIVVEVEGSPVGLVVDSASQVVRIPDDEIEPPPPLLGRAPGAYVTAVGKRGENLMILVDPRSIVTAEEVNDMNRVAAGAASDAAKGGGR